MNEGGGGRSRASDYWAGNLDPQNLDRRAESKRRIPLEDEITFANSPDVQFAKDWLLRRNDPTPTPTPTPTPALTLIPAPTLYPPSPPSYPIHPAHPVILDLGAGLGSISFVFARAGARVIAADSSLERLRELRRRANETKCDPQVIPVVAAAEALPFKEGSIPALYTKSVLIHTDLPRATAEIRRVLAPKGRAALIEPQPGNPFAWLYRRTLAPKEWQSITHYFDSKTHRFCIDQIGQGSTRHFYLFSFLAFAFQFAWPKKHLFFLSLKLFQPLDSIFFRLLPFTRRLAWFGVDAIQRE